MARNRISLFFQLFAIIFTSVVFAASEEEELLSVYGDEELISIATGTKQPIAKAPAVATVITAEDIRAMGASDLDEVLETVPGFHVSRAEIGYTAMYFIRGIFTEERNQQVLVLLNGVPLTSANFGNRGNTWGGMPVRNVARVEVIRGPGSAVYGAEAFSGVINIITKEYGDIVEQAGLRGGSFDTQEGWLLTRADFGAVKSALSIEVLNTDGHRETIENDFLSTVFGDPASLAPGPINTNKRSAELHFDLNVLNRLDLHVAYQRRYDMGTGGGIASTLDPEGKIFGHRLLTDLTYNLPALHAWDITTKLSFLDASDNADVLIQPPGALGLFPVGAIAKPEVYERHYHGNVSAFYTGFNKHRIRLGAGITVDDMYEINEKKNFGATNLPLAGGLTNAEHDPALLFIEPGSRRVYFGFVQDEWAIAPNWDLTVGVRYDTYSDVKKDTTNPRAALVWQTLPNLTSKFLYGTAFRAPSFSEQRIKNNPVIRGSANLAPETTETYELAFLYQPVTPLDLGFSMFTYTMEDILRFSGGSPRTAQNTGEQKGKGFEAEFKWKARSDLILQGNYAFQESTNKLQKHDAGHAPMQHVYVRGNWQFKPKWSLVPQFNWVIDRRRAAGDTRDEIQDYALFDLTLRYGEEKNPFSFALVGRNLFDVEAKEPSLNNTNPLTALPAAFIPKDLPLPGRAIYAEVSVKLQ